MDRETWLRQRQKGIGASDAAAIIGANPWKTNVQLWEEKTGRRQAKDIGDDPRVQYGKEAEKHLRELFRLDFPEYAVGYDEFGMISNNPSLPFAFATLDGDLTEIATRLKGILEVKTTEIMKATQWKEWDGRVPQHYYCQCLHQLLATLYDFAILKAQIKYKDKNGNPGASIKHFPILPAEVKSDMEWLADREIRFWEQVQKDIRPALILPEI